MSYKNEIETIEHEIKELSEILCESLVPLDEPYPSFFAFLNMKFARDDYPDAISSLEFQLEMNNLILPDVAQSIWVDIKTKADRALDLHRLEREGDKGYKDPITHMNALMAADNEIPKDFSKRYGLNNGDVKCLWLISPGFEERFIRRRIGDAAARGAAHYGQCRHAKKRYKITKEEAERLVDDMWENPNIVSKVFYELFDEDRLLRSRLGEESQERVLQIRADFDI